MIIKKLFNKYSENYGKIKEMNISKKIKFKSTVLGYLLSLLVVISPFIITCNFFIYEQYVYLCFFILFMLVATLITLGEIFKIKLIAFYCPNVKEISLKINLFVNSIGIYLLYLIAFGIIMLME